MNVTLKQAKERFSKLVIQYGKDVPLLFRNAWGLSRWSHGLGLWTEELHKFTKQAPDSNRYVIHTGDGHINPVTRIVVMRNRRTKQFAVCVEYDDMLEMG